MTKIVAVVAVLGLLAWAALAFGGAVVMPSYLAAWLFWMALPLGALPLVMAMELFGVRLWTIRPVLRGMLLLLPLGTVLAIPLLLRNGLWHGHPGTQALPAWWIAPPFRMIRMAVLLIVWSVLALLFARPARPDNRPRRGLAAFGLMLHLPMISVAALDWVMSLDAGLGSSAIGLLLLTAQMGTAMGAAGFVLAVSSRPADRLALEVAPLMAVSLAAWVFLQFTQFLVVWSANLPAEVAWYQARTAGLGGVVIWAAASCALLCVALLLPYRVARIPVVMAIISAMVVFAHLLEVLWLLAPAFRGALVPAWADLPALVGLGGLFAIVLLRRPIRRTAHVAP